MMAIMKDNELGQSNMNRYLKYPGRLKQSWFCLNPCIGCAGDASGTPRWGRTDFGTVGHSLIYVQALPMFRAVLVLLVYLWRQQQVTSECI